MFLAKKCSRYRKELQLECRLFERERERWRGWDGEMRRDGGTKEKKGKEHKRDLEEV